MKVQTLPVQRTVVQFPLHADENSASFFAELRSANLRWGLAQALLLGTRDQQSVLRGSSLTVKHQLVTLTIGGSNPLYPAILCWVRLLKPLIIVLCLHEPGTILG